MNVCLILHIWNLKAKQTMLRDMILKPIIEIMATIVREKFQLSVCKICRILHRCGGLVFCCKSGSFDTNMLRIAKV